MVQILQQEATLNMLLQLHKCGRATQEQIDIASRRLEELKGLEPPKTKAPPPIQVPVFKKPEPVQGPSTMNVKKDLMTEIDTLSRKRAELCNSMHDVPFHVSCPEIMNEVVIVAEQIENAWTKYRFIERNGTLPPEPTETQNQKSIKLLLKQDKREKLCQKISKLKKKINDALNTKHSKQDVWQKEFEYGVLELKELDDELYILKNR
jgi:hypothetical protein